MFIVLVVAGVDEIWWDETYYIQCRMDYKQTDKNYQLGLIRHEKVVEKCI